MSQSRDPVSASAWTTAFVFCSLLDLWTAHRLKAYIVTLTCMETPRSAVARGGGGTPVPAIQPSSSVHTSSAAKRLPDGQLLSNQSYNSIVSSGNSRLLAGNVYNNHYHLAAPTTTQVETTSDEQKRLVRTLLRCLHFKEAGSRHASIATAHPDTCRWVVDCPQYK